MVIIISFMKSLIEKWRREWEITVFLHIVLEKQQELVENMWYLIVALYFSLSRNITNFLTMKSELKIHYKHSSSSTQLLLNN